MSYLQENRWDVVDVSDVIEVCDELLADMEEPAKKDIGKMIEGFIEAVQDVKYAAEQNGKEGVDLHLESWDGFIARTANECGYMNGLEAVQDEMSKLVKERSI